jgi:4-amino-4-deoxy-L-arabinose transferase-like glycosyltransferase
MIKKNIPIVVIILFVLILALPFSNKAYHIDDTAFLYIADQIMKDPLRPYSFSLEWLSDTKSATELFDTPLVSYYIAFISWIFTRSEIILHISFIIFHIITGISFYYIVRKFINNSLISLISTLILLSTPTFIVNSQNLMPDVPMLSLFLLATALFIYGVDREKHVFLFLGSVVAGFAYLTKPNAIVIIPLFLLYCFLSKKSKYMIYQTIPLAFIILFAVHNYVFEGKVLLLSYLPFLTGAKESSFNVLAAYFFSNLSYIGGATLFPLFLLYPFILKKRNLIFLGFSVLITLIVSILLYNVSLNFLSGRYTLLQLSLFFIFTSFSIFFILLVIAENYKNTRLGVLNIVKLNKSEYDINTFFIFTWFIGIYTLNSGISGGAVRYNTLFLPPLLLSYFVLLKKYSKQFRINFFELSVLILIFTAITGLLVAYADYDYANSYRDFSNKIPQIYKT